MARKRAVKRRLDLRKGGLANRNRFQEGGETEATENTEAETQEVSSVATDREFGERTTETADPVTIDVAKVDPTIESTQVKQIAERTPTAVQKDITAPKIDATTGTATQAAQQEDIQAAQMTAAKAEDLAATEAAQGQVTRVAEAERPTLTERAVAAERDAEQETQAQAVTPELEVSEDAFVKKVVGAPADVVQTSDAEKQAREATLGLPAADREAAKVINEFGFGASKNRVIRGPEAKEAAANRLVAEHGVSKEIADSILEDVGQLVTDIDGVPQEALGAVAELPKEALVSSQMESLLAGMEEGKVPSWARAAVAGVEQRLAERGLEASTIGREALFNAIVQSTLPIAQSNATALQQRATQNLSNEQQALIQDRQIAADFLSKNAAFQQQMDLANLSNDQQMRLANLTAQNQAGSENLSASQQTELANLNSQLQSNLLQAKLAQELGVAQLSVDQQTAMRNASMVANIDFTKFNTEQQTALANSKFMQSMTMASFNANQQATMQNATAMASMDLASADQRTKLAITNAQNFLQMDMANLSNAQQSLVLDQQLAQQRLLSDQSAENASRQFNATSENQTQQFMANLAQQIETFNVSQSNAMVQFNTAEANKIASINAQNELSAAQFTNQQKQQIAMFDQELSFKADQWNAQNAQAVEQSNIAWRRQANTIDTAAQNEANKAAAQMAFSMSQAEQNFMWQRMRDEAAFAQQTAENTKERAMQILSSIYGNSDLMGSKYAPAPGTNYARDTLAPRLEKIIDLF